MAALDRHAHARALLGATRFERVASARVLVVGAGGIGCELLKNLVLVGFKDIEVIDLDTIDLSNLNRQFLFNKSHIKKSKALIASATAQSFCPSARITPHHADIMRGGPSGADAGARFGVAYFEQFDVVLNALDNLEARRHVNRMCVAARVPLVESGTAGFLGQVQPIMKGVTECYDCVAKETPKSFPVCTIRSTPSTPIHCIVWAKSWLFTQLFGADDETEDAELDKALQDGENATEISNLRAEAQEMRNLRVSLTEAGRTSRENAAQVFAKIFSADVKRLLGMEEMWKNRRKPVPLDFEEAMSGERAGEGSGLRDQRALSLRETVELFEQSLASLSARAAKSPEDPLSFDKDDDDALDFVTAVANLRARVYGIDTRTRFQVKQMAGNIIPAIASTNAIIAGALVLQALHALDGNWTQARLVNKTAMPRFLVGSQTCAPNPACGVCADVYVALQADPARLTLGQLLQDVARASREEGGLGMETEDVEVYEGSRLLADSDFDDNHAKTLAELNIGIGNFVALVDEGGEKSTIQFVIERLSPASGGVDDERAWALPPAERLPELSDKVEIPAPAPDSDDDDDDDVAVVDAPSAPKATGGQEKASRKRAAADDADGAADETTGAAAGESDVKRPRIQQTGADASSAIEL